MQPVAPSLIEGAPPRPPGELVLDQKPANSASASGPAEPGRVARLVWSGPGPGPEPAVEVGREPEPAGPEPEPAVEPEPEPDRRWRLVREPEPAGRLVVSPSRWWRPSPSW